MKDKNFILFGSSGGIGSQLAADLNDCKSKLLVGYHHAVPDYGFSVEKSAPVDASSFESVINFIEEAKIEHYNKQSEMMLTNILVN